MIWLCEKEKRKKMAAIKVTSGNLHLFLGQRDTLRPDESFICGQVLILLSPYRVQMWLNLR